jgi:hypothetical protein
VRRSGWPIFSAVVLIIAIMVVYGLTAHNDEQTARTG